CERLTNGRTRRQKTRVQHPHPTLPGPISRRSYRRAGQALRRGESHRSRHPSYYSLLVDEKNLCCPGETIRLRMEPPEWIVLGDHSSLPAARLYHHPVLRNLQHSSCYWADLSAADNR
ncbi:MAG: hypothetical protein WBH86_14585, partial [Thermogutta sp.]